MATSTSASRALLSTSLSDVLRTTYLYLRTLKDLGVSTVQDFLLYFPRAYRDRTDVISIREIQFDGMNVVQGRLSQLFGRKTRSGKYLTRAILTDETGTVEVMWFNQPHLHRMFHNGDEVILTGKVKAERGCIIFLSPQYEIVRKKQLHMARLVPVYSERAPVTSKWIREKIDPLLKATALLEDVLPSWIVETHGLMPYSEAVKTLHDPSDEAMLNRARYRLAFEELFLLQVAALQRRWRFRQQAHRTDRGLCIDSAVQKAFLERMGFILTAAQKRVMREVAKDLTSPYPMMRLLQGDVGSGKTVIAAFALLHAMKSGFQATLMVPTEILAKQHYHTLSRLLKGFGLNLQLLVGSLNEAAKHQLHAQIATGTVEAVVGTHALIQEGVRFRNLGVAVIDEQHRFGVRQRERLAEQGSPHVLSLSATPIPRTLAMVLYGDQDVSTLDELPPGRQTIVTRVVPERKRRDAEFWIADQIKKGRQVYIICPLIDESDVLGVKAVSTEYQRLKKEVFKEFRIGLLHGKLKPSEKELVMDAFHRGELDLLVSTSVVEVGIDVPNATIMLIEGADRFGLSQLHQFRGRVGRGSYQSYCFLFTDVQSVDARERLQALVQHSSGFKLAEIDLLLRGPGEVYGVRQSGIPDLRMASLGDTALIQEVRRVATTLILKDPELCSTPKLAALLAAKDEVAFF